jgi:hypothetical protein
MGIIIVFTAEGQCENQLTCIALEECLVHRRYYAGVCPEEDALKPRTNEGKENRNQNLEVTAGMRGSK